MKLLNLSLIVLIAIFFIITSSASAQLAPSASSGLADSPWPMLHGNLRHTGLSPYSTKGVDGTVKWTFETGAGIESSPTIGPDGTIYIGSHDNKLYALNPDGTLKWKFDAGDPIYIPEWDVWKGIPSAPTIGKDGTIYFVAPPIYMFALNPDGSEKWRYPVYTSSHIGASPVIVRNGTIYISSESYPHVQPGGPINVTDKSAPDEEFGARVYAINSDGTLKWRYDSNGACLANPIAVANDGTIYVTGSDLSPEPPNAGDALFAFNPDGTIKWKFKTNRIEGAPAIAEDGTIYVGTKDGRLIAFDPDGSQKWVFQTGNGISAIAALGKDGTIYFGSWDGNFYALNPEGKELWHFDTKIGRDPKIFESPYMETITTSAAISADGTIYFGDIIDTFYALDLSGREKWRYKTTGGGFVSSPAIGADGTVYVGSWDKKVYAFGTRLPVLPVGRQARQGSSVKKDIAGEKTVVYIAVVAIALVLVIAGTTLALRKKFNPLREIPPWRKPEGEE